MVSSNQLYKELGFYASREYLPWKVRAGDIHALVDLGYWYYKHNSKDWAEYYFKLAMKYNAADAYVSYADFLYSSEDKKTREEAFGYYVDAALKGHNANGVIKLAQIYLKQRDKYKGMSSLDSFLKRMVDDLYEVATNPKEEGYNKALRLLKKLDANEHICRAKEVRRGQLFSRLKAWKEKRWHCKRRIVEVDEPPMWLPGPWKTYPEKNITWLSIAVGGIGIGLAIPYLAILVVVGLAPAIAIIVDKIRLFGKITYLSIPKLRCGIDVNLAKRHSFYNGYTGDIVFKIPKAPSGSDYARYKWEAKKPGLFDSYDKPLEYERKLESFDGVGYASAWEAYKMEFTQQVASSACARRAKLLQLQREKPSESIANVLHDIYGVVVDENGETQNVEDYQYIVKGLYCDGESRAYVKSTGEVLFEYLK